MHIDNFLRINSFKLYNLRLIIIFVMLLISSIYDYKYFKIPNKITYSILIISILLTEYEGNSISSINVYGFILGWMIVFIPAFIMIQPMGGDMKLLSSLGFLMGPQFVIQLMTTTLLVGFPIAVIHRYRVKKKENLPFAVLLFIGYILLLIINFI